jgi:hypothetical protein
MFCNEAFRLLRAHEFYSILNNLPFQNGVNPANFLRPNMRETPMKLNPAPPLLTLTCFLFCACSSPMQSGCGMPESDRRPKSAPPVADAPPEMADEPVRVAMGKAGDPTPPPDEKPAEFQGERVISGHSATSK